MVLGALTLQSFAFKNKLLVYKNVLSGCCRDGSKVNSTCCPLQKTQIQYSEPTSGSLQPTCNSNSEEMPLISDLHSYAHNRTQKSFIYAISFEVIIPKFLCFLKVYQYTTHLSYLCLTHNADK